MKSAAVLALFLASAAAFTTPQFATRAVGATKKVPAKAPAKVVAKAPVKAAKVAKAPAKAAKVAKAPVKAVKKAVAKAPVAKVAAAVSAPKPPPVSQGYPSFADKAQNFKLGSISGGGNRSVKPVFVHPTINTKPAPSFDYKELGKKRLSKNQEFVFEDGLTELERKQRATIPAFLTGSAKSQADPSTIRDDIVAQEYPFGLNGDRFQLLFISFFGLFTLVGCLSGTIKFD
jgi:hypothetical protein